MTAIIYSIFGFILAVGLLTTVHEFGHFWVARRMGIRVLRFSIGFGRSLVSWYDRSGCEYVIAAIPLGGYVKMLDETEGPVPSSEKHMAFNQKSVYARMAVILAGPLFNIIFAVFAYWMVFMVGVSAVIPVIGSVPKGSIADLAGLSNGQEIVAIDDQVTRNWEDVSVALMDHLGEEYPVTFKVRDIRTQAVSEHRADLTNWMIDSGSKDMLTSLGLEPYDPIPPIIGAILPDTPAADSGLEAGDLILTADGKAYNTRTELTLYLRQKAAQAVNLEVKRGDENFNISLTPMRRLLEGGEEVGFIGIQYAAKPWPKELIRLNQYGPYAALKLGVERTIDYTYLTVKVFVKMVTGKVSYKHVGGPISIARYAGKTVSSGIEYFLGFLALISISLGVLNMLPIPILDGGHFLFCLIELINGKPLPERFMEIGVRFGMVLIVAVMLLAFYNDLTRL